MGSQSFEKLQGRVLVFVGPLHKICLDLKKKLVSEVVSAISSESNQTGTKHRPHRLKIV